MRQQKMKILMLGLTLISTTFLPYSSLYAGNETPKRMITLQRTGKRMKPLKPKAPDRQIVTARMTEKTYYSLS